MEKSRPPLIGKIIDRLPFLENTNWLTSGNARMAVNHKKGGKITFFGLGDFNFLTGEDIDPLNYGSTFWPSPQSIWDNWPPPKILDSSYYFVRKIGNSIRLISQKDKLRDDGIKHTGLQVIKEFSPGENGRMKIKYTIRNISHNDIKVAPWEITRVPWKDGLVFFPLGKPIGKNGEQFLKKNEDFDNVPFYITEKGGRGGELEKGEKIAWYQGKEGSPNNIKNDLLSGVDCKEGWVAYALGKKLFIKKFSEVNPNETGSGAPLSIYVNKDRTYMEIEPEGERQTLKPGEKSQPWKVEWIAVDIPKGMEAKEGNMDLVNFVREIVK